ncbi:MAG TPA: DUF222 domain-containing protein [Mycobacteriales bacterium]|nr:DUF222 domain-containing protein [Mycobacteriales bacterium]
MSDVVASVVEQLSVLLGSCRDARLWGLSDAQVDELLVRVHQQLGQITGTLLLPLVREAESRGLAAAHDAPTMKAWLRDALNVRPGEAGRLLRLAKALDGDLPETAAALADGAISVEHAQVIADAVRALPAETPAETRVAAERELVAHSGTFNPDEVALLGRRVLDVVDPDHGEELLRRQAEREAAEAHTRRDLRICPAGPGLKRISGFLDTEGAETLRVALDPLAAPRPADPDTGVRDDRTHGQRMADALVELAERALRMGELPDNGGERPTLIVTMPYDKLAAATGVGTLDSGDILPASQVRRLACDANIIPAVLGGESQVLDLGRGSRHYVGAARRAIILRDRGCIFPACDRPYQWCQVHHCTHWANGGRTDQNNGVLLCGHHHRAVHHNGWDVRIAHDGLPELLPPRTIDPERKPVRHHRHRKRAA